MVFNPEIIEPGAPPSLQQEAGQIWTPLFRHTHCFPPEIFREVMLNLIRNPNINSNHLFRADISLDIQDAPNADDGLEETARIIHFRDFELKRVMVRTMVPRNILVDNPLDQTCLFFENEKTAGELSSLVIYLPHISSPEESPFYHPAVHGIAFLHSFAPSANTGHVSIHYCFFESVPRSPKLERTAQHLLAVLHKHGQGNTGGYVKRVHHDQVLPQAVVQTTYARLKATYAKRLIQGWVESTDPEKHVFEDLGIAAFLIELWKDMYGNQQKDFPGFVDIGCGNGLLVHLLTEEGYKGWGFDARKRKSWDFYDKKSQDNLKEMVLIPSPICTTYSKSFDIDQAISPEASSIPNEQLKGRDNDLHNIEIHNGLFAKGTFIISNHADELTPWTPILATMSESPFMMIPCCSHALNGSRFRAPPPKDTNATSSTYASLVEWVSTLAADCGWKVEKEMLRIPSTRNTALIGRQKTISFTEVDVKGILRNYGGAEGWEENALKLVRGATRGH